MISENVVTGGDFPHHGLKERTPSISQLLQSEIGFKKIESPFYVSLKKTQENVGWRNVMTFTMKP